MKKVFFPKGDLAKAEWDVVVDNTIDGWQHTGVRVGDFSKSKTFSIAADKVERLIWPLDGESITVSYTVDNATTEVKLRGRKSVFHGTTDLQYISIDTAVTITGTGRFIIDAGHTLGQLGETAANILKRGVRNSRYRLKPRQRLDTGARLLRQPL